MTRPDEVSDEMLMALADGELNELEAQRLRRLIVADQSLAARYRDFATTRSLLQDAFPLEPVPDRLRTAVMAVGEPKVVPMRKSVTPVAGWGMALAASLVLAVGGFVVGRGTLPDEVDVAQATATLMTGAESSLSDGSTVRVLGSYDTDIGLCRLIAQDDLRHVVCRDPQAGGWVTALSVEAGSADNFMPASDVSVAVIDRLLDDVGAGPALDPTEEGAALMR
jgi:hypothetical protein